MWKMVAAEKSERASIASHLTTHFGASWCNHISDPDITGKNIEKHTLFSPNNTGKTESHTGMIMFDFTRL